MPLTQQQVIEILIPIYEKGIALAETTDDIYGYLYKISSLYIGLGICWAVERYTTETRWDHEYWIEASQGYWYKTPLECETIPQAVDCIQFRLDKLKKLLEECKEK